MKERFRLNLEAPFLRAAAPDNSHPAIDRKTDDAPRRPSPSERRQGDLSGTAMTRYLGGLEARLTDHVRRHAPHWHQAETSRVLNRWSAPRATHPAPSWAPPRNVQAEAREYAGQRVRERIAARFQRLHDIRLVRTLSDLGEVSLLRTPTRDQKIRNKNRQKL